VTGSSFQLEVLVCGAGVIIATSSKLDIRQINGFHSSRVYYMCVKIYELLEHLRGPRRADLTDCECVRNVTDIPLQRGTA